MATTKFLDYTGLSKLVEKIKNTYVRQDSQYEANLKWGGKNFAGSFGPIDAAMIPELGANRFAFASAKGITIEYSNDAGKTWTDYGATDSQKTGLCSRVNLDNYFVIGKTKSATPANDMLRITFDADKLSIYTVLNKICIYCSVDGSRGTYCTIQTSTYGAPTTFDDKVVKQYIDGWSGYNIIQLNNFAAFGGSQNSHIRYLRFIFGCTIHDGSQYSGLKILNIFAFGGVGWTVPNSMARNGHIYSYDDNQNVIFPAQVVATKNFKGYLNGTASNADNASKVNNHTVLSDVPANAKFTDTVYSLPVASENTLGGIKTGYKTAQDRNYGVKLTADNQAFVTIPWTDTTYDDLKGATTSAAGTHGLVPAPTKSDVSKFLKGDGTWGTPVAAVQSLSANSVNSILSGTTNRYSGFLDGDGLQLVVNELKALMNDTVELSFDTVDVMNFAGSTERVAIKMSEEMGQTKFFDNFNTLKFIKFNDGCVFTRIGITTSQGFPVFKGSVVDQMQGVDDMVAWISNDGTNFYLVFDDASNVSSSGFLDDAYTPTSSEIKLTWDN